MELQIIYKGGIQEKHLMRKSWFVSSRRIW